MGTNADSGMEMRDLLSDPDFSSRPLHRREPNREYLALCRLARLFAERPETFLQELVDLAVEFCGADSAGVSLEEPDEKSAPRFRWVAVAGSFAQYLNGTTPRFYSPCGTCLDSGKAQLYRVTQPYYDFLGVEAKPITDGLLIPWAAENIRGTIWAVAHGSSESFDVEDYRLLSALGDFVAIAMRHEAHEKDLRQRMQELASARRANALAHEINNPLQSLTNTLYLARSGGEEAQAYLSQAEQELQILSELVRRLLSSETSE